MLLLGDTTVVPTFEISFGTTTANGTTNPNFPEEVVATDMPYGFIHQAGQVDASLAAGVDKITDYNPDLFVARVPVPDNDGQTSVATAAAELTMIHNYEDSPPPAGSPFYQNVVGAEFFQALPGHPGRLRSFGHPRVLLCTDGAGRGVLPAQLGVRRHRGPGCR